MILRGRSVRISAWLAAITITAPFGTTTALGQTAPVPTTPETAVPTAAPAAPAQPTPSAPPAGYWINGIHLSAQIDAGIIANPFRPQTGLTWGQLFTDHANQVQLNQLLLTANKPLDPKNAGYQWGFKVQLMYGSDARYTQFLGELNRVDPNARNQLDVVEANLLFHTPWLSSGGIDWKIGQYPTPLGYEVIDPSQNPFYSHSYIFQFGLPFKHTGGYATWHATDLLDVYGGLDTGSNTTFGPLGDNNGAVAGLAGFGLNNLLGGNLTVLALTHFGPEDSTRVFDALSPTVNANGQWRYFNDAVITYKATSALALTTELNLVRESFNPANGRPANGFGAAQYASYSINDNWILNGRIEYWRDDNNFFVASFSSNDSFVMSQQGLSVSGIHVAPDGSTTYGALTLGVTYKPTLPPWIEGVLIRPEIRWDHAFTDNRPFNNNPPANDKGTSNSFTFGIDAVITF
jgi:hypothetical protein